MRDEDNLFFPHHRLSVENKADCINKANMYRQKIDSIMNELMEEMACCEDENEHIAHSLHPFQLLQTQLRLKSRSSISVRQQGNQRKKSQGPRAIAHRLSCLETFYFHQLYKRKSSLAFVTHRNYPHHHPIRPFSVFVLYWNLMKRKDHLKENFHSLW